MDQLLAGEDSIDVEDWQDHTLYKDCSESEPQIQWFWDLVASYDQSQLEALLAFVTCSPAPPTGQLPCHYPASELAWAELAELAWALLPVCSLSCFATSPACLLCVKILQASASQQ